VLVAAMAWLETERKLETADDREINNQLAF
jgi:hypothetical protein